MTKDEATNGVIRYWQFIVVIIGMGVGYGSMTTNIDALAQDLQEQKTETKQAEQDRQQVKLSVVAIEKDVEHIKRELDKQDQKLDRILDKLNEQ